MLRRPAFCIYCVLPVADADGFDGNASAADHFNVVEFFFHQADDRVIFSGSLEKFQKETVLAVVDDLGFEGFCDLEEFRFVFR